MPAQIPVYNTTYSNVHNPTLHHNVIVCICGRMAKSKFFFKSQLSSSLCSWIKIEYGVIYDPGKEIKGIFSGRVGQDCQMSPVSVGQGCQMPPVCVGQGCQMHSVSVGQTSESSKYIK